MKFFSLFNFFRRPKTRRILPKISIIPKNQTPPISPISPISLTQSELDLYT